MSASSPTPIFPRLERRIDQALGREKADLVIKNVRLLNVADGSLEKTDIAICGDTIVGTYGTYSGVVEIDGSGLAAAPGFIDTHVHIESSLVTPYEFDRCALMRGTTTAVCDPHEMANVLGEAAFEFFLKSSENTVMDIFVQLSSCVPATKLETSGATLTAEALVKFKGHPWALGLAEFMDIGGVLGKAPDALAKLEAFKDRHIDGHMPGITGYALNALASCGIRNCHESFDLPQAQEKLKKGVNVLIREGSVCKDLKALHSLIEPFKAARLGFCTDDRKPTDIIREGHIDHLIRKAIERGADVATSYRVATLSAAEGFGLRDRGLIAPGYKADIVLLDDIEECRVHAVIKDGRPVTPERFATRPAITPVGYNSVKIKEIAENDFVVRSFKNPVDVIGIIKDQIMTAHLQAVLPVNARGELQPDPASDILKIAVLERHGKNGNIGVGFVKGFGITEGALASSVGHDSHNITVVGATDRDMAVAVNRLRELQGGFVVVRNGVVESELALPIAGLMSDKPYENVVHDLDALMNAVAVLKPHTMQPFMHLAFLPLCVIPTLKITDFGLTRFAPDKGDQGPVLIHDQRRPAGPI